MKIPECYRSMEKQARKAGWNITRPSGSHHLHWTSPAGRVVYTPSTPSGYRARQHVKAQLRRAGLVLPA